MVYANFSKNGYVCVKDGDWEICSTDISHYLLLDYISKDMSSLPILFEQYIAKGLDLDTFTLKNYNYEKEDCFEIVEKLKSLHKYYEHEYPDVIIKSIGYFLNDTIIYLHANAYGKIKELINEERKVINYTSYKKIFQKLTVNFLQYVETYTKKFYSMYLEEMTNDKFGYDVDDEAEGIFVASELRPSGFSFEIETQKKINDMIYWILDTTNPDLDELSTSQRIWLYNNIFNYAGTLSDSQIIVKKHLHYKSTILNQDMGRYEAPETYQLFKPLSVFSEINGENEDIPADIKNKFSTAIKCAKELSKLEIFEVCEIESINDLLTQEVLFMIQNNILIKKCKNCGKYFVITNRKTAYCDREDEGGVRCSSVGSKKNFKKKMDAEYSLKIYNRAYKTHHSRYKKGSMSPNEFQLWCIEAKEKLRKVRIGDLETLTFEEWLKI